MRLTLVICVALCASAEAPSPAEHDASSKASLQQELNAAFSLHTAGKYPDAALQYRRVISALQASLDSSAGNMLQALTICAHNLALISALHLDDFQQASQWFTEATRLQPSYFAAYHNLGQALSSRSRFEEAINQFSFDIRLRPDSVDPVLATAACHYNLGDHRASSSHALRAAEMSPSSPTTLSDAGRLLLLAERYRAAEQILRRGLQLDPSSADMHLNIGKALSDIGDSTSAVNRLQKALELDPFNHETDLFLGREYFKIAEAAGDGSDELWRKCIRGLEMALPSLNGKVAPVALNHLAWAHWQVGHHEHAFALLERGLSQDDGNCDLHVRRLMLQVHVANFTQIHQGRRRIHALLLQQLQSGQTPSIDPFNIMFLNVVPPEERLPIYRKYSQALAESAQNLLSSVQQGRTSRLPDRERALQVHEREDKNQMSIVPGEKIGGKLRVGFMSVDFRDHPLGSIMRDLFEAVRFSPLPPQAGESSGLNPKMHEDEKVGKPAGTFWSTLFEIVAISLAPRRDGMTEEILSQVDQTLDVANMQDDRAAAAIRNLSLDILVDLSGHSKGSRARLLAFSLAPVVVHYLGCVDTMAMDNVHYLFADRHVAPPEFRGLYHEHLVLMPTTFHFYSSRLNRFHSDGLDPGRTQGRRSNSGVVSLDAQVDTDRIEGHMWQTWLRLLAASPHTTLRLRQARYKHAHRLLEDTIAASARTANVSRDRLHFLAKTSPKAAHLERLATGSDLFLDTDSYSAHSTALDALWAGVPILTFPRQTFASRVPCSFLEALGQGHLIARNIEEYEGIARKLIDSPSALSLWRRRLWLSRLATTGLFGEILMVENMKVGLKLIWELAVAFDARKHMHVLVH